MTFGMTVLTIIAVGTTGLLLFATVSGLPSMHRFTPNPDRPRECMHCGRRAEYHREDNND